MMNARKMVRKGSALMLGAGLLAVGPLAACSAPTCAAGDDACILSHLRIYDQGGNPVALDPGARPGG